MPTRAETYVLPLEARGLTLEIAGGKGANLATLIERGFAVPGGFVVTTQAYSDYVKRNGLDSRIIEALSGVDADQPAALEAASQAIRASFSTGSLPSSLDDALRQAYTALGRPAVAVRSSATAEDLPHLSFAGQQDTFLNVVGDKALQEAVVKCWSSLWTARAIGYRTRNQIAHDGLALAVVVQEMVQSEASGVLFTANPLDGKRTEIVIEATLGLGEALVSGLVEPDHYCVDAASGEILIKTLGSKALAIRSREGGGTVRVDDDASIRQALPDGVIVELARLGRDVAAFLGGPQDVEWAWAGGHLHLLQARPITSLFPLPADVDPDPLLVMFSFAAVQGVLDPITPLGREVIRSLFSGAGGLFGLHLTAETQNAIKESAERLWVNLSGLLRHRVYRRPARAFLGIIEPASAQVLDALWEDPRLAPVEGFGPRTMRQFVPVLIPTVGRLVLTLVQPDRERQRFHDEAQALAASVGARLAAATTLSAQVTLVEEVLGQTFRFLLPRFVPRFGAGMAGLNILNHLAASVPGGDADALALTRGMPHNVTTEMDLALWETAQAIKADAAALAQFQGSESQVLAAKYLAVRLPEPAQAAVTAFMQRYGMRGVGEIDLGRPRWREEPTPIMQSLQSYLQINDSSLAPDAAFQHGAEAAEAALADLVQALRQTGGGRFKARLAHFAARRMRALAGLREAPKFWAIRIMGMLRAALLDSGQALVAEGSLAQADDLFFLHLVELKALASGQERDWIALVSERRAAHAREQNRRQIPRLLLSDGQAFYEGMRASEPEDDGILAGSAVSPGVMEGRVQVVLDPHQTRLAPGEILVCPGTDPAWTPLFLVAGGLVTEVGGLMTHGSVVAREYGIPAVVGVDRATTRLRTGQRVRVDGSAGTVRILEPEHS